jgi:hypothetical protein
VAMRCATPRLPVRAADRPVRRGHSTYRNGPGRVRASWWCRTCCRCR